MRKELDSRAHQFRVVQKRMLTRFKDKTPTPLQKLDTLLSQTYDDVLFLADRLKEANHVLVILESRVAAGSQALLLLMRLKFHLGPDDLEVLQNVFNPRNSRNFEQGWEEALDNALLYLLKTTLTKDPKDMQGQPPASITPPHQRSPRCSSRFGVGAAWCLLSPAQLTRACVCVCVRARAHVYVPHIPAPDHCVCARAYIACRVRSPCRAAVSAMTKLTLPADTSKLKKHITQVCEKIHKGFRLVPQMRPGQDE